MRASSRVGGKADCRGCGKKYGFGFRAARGGVVKVEHSSTSKGKFIIEYTILKKRKV